MGVFQRTLEFRPGDSRRCQAFTVEMLEHRMLLAYAPVGGELRANTYTDFNQINPAIAADGDGDFVVTWSSAVQDGGGFGVYAQRYSAAGDRRGVEFRVNVTTSRWQENPSVAMDADGDFVVVWENHENDFERDVYARLYSAGGSPRTGEVVVNLVRGGDQGRPSVAMSDDGGFVVAWDAVNQDGDGRGIVARRFSAAGIAMTGELPVNATSAGQQVSPSVATDADGDFAVAWTGQGAGATRSAFVRRFGADGLPQGDELPLATAVELATDLGLGMSANGAFVVAWGTYNVNQEVFSGDVYAQRFTAAGAPAGSAFVVNETIAGAQTDPSVGMDADGNFMIAWANYAEVGGELDLYARSYNSAGTPDGGEFAVNASTAAVQNLPAVTMDDAGGAIIAWHSNHPANSQFDVYVQRFSQRRPPTVTGVFLGASAWTSEFRTLLQSRGMGESAFGFAVPAASQLATLSWTRIDRVSVRFSEDVVVGLGDLAVRGVNVSQYPVTAVTYHAPTRTATWTLGRGFRGDKVVIDVDGDAGGVLAGGVRLDGEWTGNSGTPDAFPSGDGVPGGDFVFRINVLPGDVNGDRAVNAHDLLDLRRRLVSFSPSQPAGSLLHDLNGDAALTVIDQALLRRGLSSRLPDAEPVIFSAAASPVRRRSPVGRSLYGA